VSQASDVEHYIIVTELFCGVCHDLGLFIPHSHATSVPAVGATRSRWCATHTHLMTSSMCGRHINCSCVQGRGGALSVVPVATYDVRKSGTRLSVMFRTVLRHFSAACFRSVAVGGAGRSSVTRCQSGKGCCSVCPCIDGCACLECIHPSFHPPTHTHTHPHLPLVYLSIYLSTYLSIYLSICMTILLSVRLSD
jgi:hypothetical protein